MVIRKTKLGAVGTLRVQLAEEKNVSLSVKLFHFLWVIQV